MNQRTPHGLGWNQTESEPSRLPRAVHRTYHPSHLDLRSPDREKPPPTLAHDVCAGLDHSSSRRRNQASHCVPRGRAEWLRQPTLPVRNDNLGIVTLANTAVWSNVIGDLICLELIATRLGLQGEIKAAFMATLKLKLALIPAEPGDAVETDAHDSTGLDNTEPIGNLHQVALGHLFSSSFRIIPGLKIWPGRTDQADLYIPWVSATGVTSTIEEDRKFHAFVYRPWGRGHGNTTLYSTCGPTRGLDDSTRKIQSLYLSVLRMFQY